jgi:hypothetical protein
LQSDVGRLTARRRVTKKPLPLESARSRTSHDSLPPEEYAEQPACPSFVPLEWHERAMKLLAASRKALAKKEPSSASGATVMG